MINAKLQREEARLRRYLLGRLDSTERATVEQRMLTEPQYFSELSRAEEELIDDYARGTLEPAEKQEFERYFMNNPARREEAGFAQALNRYVSEQEVADVPVSVSAPRLSWMGRPWAIAAACALLIGAVTAIWFYRQTRILQAQIAVLQQEKSQIDRQAKDLQARAASLAARVESEHQASSDPGHGPSRTAGLGTLSLVLSPGLSRAAEQSAAVSISAGIRRLRLELEMASPDYTSYRAELQTVEGQTIWSRSALVSQTEGRVVMEVPAANLNRSDYVVMLKGQNARGAYEKIGSYYFRVERAKPAP